MAFLGKPNKSALGTVPEQGRNLPGTPKPASANPALAKTQSLKRSADSVPMEIRGPRPLSHARDGVVAYPTGS